MKRANKRRNDNEGKDRGGTRITGKKNGKDECLAEEIREAVALIAKRIQDRYACDYALLPSSIPLV